MSIQNQDKHNSYQREYFDKIDRSRLSLGETTYVVSHLNKVIDAADLQLSNKILEIGAGPGKFTLPLFHKGFNVIANDLSSVLLNKLEKASDGKIKTICCDVSTISNFSMDKFDKVIGFFVLHHLQNFDRLFSELAKVVAPGGLVVFCEPVAWNPLYYVQIALTPSMRFSGEPSITSMRPGVILPSMKSAGFIDTDSYTYGYFPPIIKNHPLGDSIERWLEKQKTIPFPNAFQIFTARMPG